jgi:hypothetical protein
MDHARFAGKTGFGAHRTQVLVCQNGKINRFLNGENRFAPLQPPGRNI